MKRNILSISALAAVMSVSAQSDFNRVLSSAVATNPDIVALDLSSKAQLEELKSENVLEGPELDAGHEWGHYGDRKMHIGISQGFDWPGLYKARRDHTRSTSLALDALKLSTINEKTLEAKLMLIDIIAAKRRLDLLSEMQQTMRNLDKQYATAYEHGEVSVLDVNKISIELLKANRAADEQSTRYGDLLSSFASLAGRSDIIDDARQLTDYPVEAILTESEYENMIHESDPSVLYWQAMAKVAEDNARVGRLSSLPGFSVGYELSREEGQNFNGITLGIKLPRWTNRHSTAAAKLTSLENETQLNTTIMRRSIDMRNDLETAADLNRQIKDYEKIFANGRHAELLKKAFDGGQINLLNYLLELNYFVEARLDYENVCYELSLIKARLNRLNK